MPSVLWKGSTSLQEQPDSPLYDYAERYTITRMFKGPHATCLSSAPMPGTAGTGDYAGYFVQRAVVSKEPGGIGKLVITYGPGIITTPPSGAAAVLPPDECGIGMERLDKPLENHSRYSSVSNTVIKAIRLLLQNEDQYSDDYEPIVTADTLGSELWVKMKRGNTHYAIWVPVYRWRVYYWVEPFASSGGFLEVPYGPISPPTIDWLRQADSLDFNGTQWVLERSWIGGPEVDTDIYPAA